MLEGIDIEITRFRNDTFLKRLIFEKTHFRSERLRSDLFAEMTFRNDSLHIPTTSPGIKLKIIFMGTEHIF